MEQMKDLSAGPDDGAFLRLGNGAVVGPYDGAAEGVDDGMELLLVVLTTTYISR